MDEVLEKLKSAKADVYVVTALDELACNRSKIYFNINIY